MKVLYVLPPAPDLADFNPLEDYVLELAAAVSRRGVESFILVPAARAKFLAAVSGVRILTWDQGDFALAFRKIIREVRPNVVQVENEPHLIRPIRLSYEGQLVLNLHSLRYLAGQHIPRSELRVALCLVDKVVLLSHFLKSLFLGRYFGLRLRTAVVHPGVDTNKYSPFQGSKALEKERLVVRRSWGVDRELIALFAAHPDPQKGLDVVVRAWRELKDTPIKLVIAGPLPAGFAQVMGGELQLLKNRIVHLSETEHSAMPSIYRAADLLVYPSQGREALGVANIEALASGLPVVASFRGGITEVVTDECGYLVRQYSQPESWSKFLGQVANQPGSLQALALNARKRGLLFSWDRAVCGFMQVYGTS